MKTPTVHSAARLKPIWMHLFYLRHIATPTDTSLLCFYGKLSFFSPPPSLPPVLWQTICHAFQMHIANPGMVIATSLTSCRKLTLSQFTVFYTQPINWGVLAPTVQYTQGPILVAMREKNNDLMWLHRNHIMLYSGLYIAHKTTHWLWYVGTLAGPHECKSFLGPTPRHPNHIIIILQLRERLACSCWTQPEDVNQVRGNALDTHKTLTVVFVTYVGDNSCQCENI